MTVGIAPARTDSYGLPDLGYLKGIAEGSNATFQTITAHSGGTQAAALQIASNAAIVYVGTVAADNDSIMLNFAIAGRVVFIINAGAHILNIYASPVANKANGNVLDTINNVANATSYNNAGGNLAAGKMAIFVCGTNGKWSAMSGGAA